MPRLREIVGSLLRDLSWAQHQSNLYSRALSEGYRSDAILRRFAVPNASLSHLTLQLRFAVVDGDRAEPRRGDAEGGASLPTLPPTSRFLEIGGDLGAVALAETSRRIDSTVGAKNARPSDERLARILALLNSERVRTELGEAIGIALRDWHTAARPDGIEGALAAVERTIGHRLLHDPALTDLLGDADDDAFLDALRPRLRQTLEDAIERLDRVNVDPTELPNVDVVIDAATLAGYPDHALQTMELRLDLRNYKWVVSTNGKDDDLIPDP